LHFEHLNLATGCFCSVAVAEASDNLGVQLFERIAEVVAHGVHVRCVASRCVVAADVLRLLWRDVSGSPRSCAEHLLKYWGARWGGRRQSEKLGERGLVWTELRDGCQHDTLVPSLILGLQVVQGLRVVPLFLYRYSMEISLKKARSPRTTEGGRSDWALESLHLQL
jgi:hypothetical protein